MSMLKLSATVVTFLIVVLSVRAQEVWSLERCVKHATENSIAARQSGLQVTNADVSNRLTRNQRIPALNASASYGLNYGRTIDPLTNTFVNQSIQYNSYSLNGSWLVYQGGRVNAQIRQADLALEAAKADAQQNINDIALQVSSLYLSAVLAEAQVDIARERLNNAQAQLRDTEILIRAGSLPPGSRFEVEAMVERERQLLVQSENIAIIQKLNLMNLLELDPSQPITLERPQVDLLRPPAETYHAASIYRDATAFHPGITAARLNSESAQMGVEVAQRQLWPTLAIFAQLNTNYSNQGVKIDGFTTVPVQQTVRIDGQPFTIETDQQIPNLIANPYFNQINENFGQGFGVSLSIPIINGFQRRLGIEQARVNALSAGLQEMSRKHQLRTEIQQAVADVEGAWRNLEAADKFEQASEQAFNSVQARYSLGAGTVLELNVARSSYETARIEKTNAQYEYIFRLKVLEYYMGQDMWMTQ